MFDQSRQGTSLAYGYIEQIIKKKDDYINLSSSGSFKSRDEYSAFLSKIKEQKHRLWAYLDKWLLGRVLGGGTVDSFPPAWYELTRFDTTETTTRTTYDPYYDTEETSEKKENETIKVGVDYFGQLYDTMQRLPDEKEGFTDPNDGSRVYELMKPIYSVLHPITFGSCLKHLGSPVLFILVCLGICKGLQFLSEKINNLLYVLLLILWLGGVLLIVGGVIWLLIRLYESPQEFRQAAKLSGYRRDAKRNVPKVYRVLRYYHLWEKQTGKTYEGVTKMQEYFDEYIKKFG
ncbi:MAG: hypothetical protein ACI4XJ_11350 [Eubacteriales bacterium]